MNRRRKLAYLAIANVLALLLLALAIEVAGRVFLLVRPSWDVVFLKPERSVGWTQVPGLRWTWAGTHWYARGFSVDVQTNSLGFRDLERVPAKPEGTLRVALLGDSFVEAVQVPFERTAGHLLEQRLNAGRTTGPRYEVLNFGISNYGVGQYLLAWETYARRFAPDVVFAFVAGLHMARTVRSHETGAFGATAGTWLWVRPTFRLHDGALVRRPARDFDEFVRVQERLVREEFGGRRMQRRESSVIAHYAKTRWAAALGRGPVRRSEPPPPDPPLGPDAAVAVSLAVLRDLGRQVRSADAVLAVVDVARYLDPQASELSAALARLCAEEGLGYVPLGERLLTAQSAGRATHWGYDGHFNETGNELFAEALEDWMTERAGASQWGK